MPASSIDQITPPVGPNIVRAWFESAINPLLLGLENEQAVLSKHTFTWREHDGLMLVIRSVRSHVPFGKWANFEQFLYFYSDITELCKRHDAVVNELTQACLLMYESLMSSGAFKDSVEKAYESDRLELNPGQTKELFQQMHPFGEIVRWIGEHVVNGSERLGRHYATAAIWNPFRDDFLAFRGREPVRSRWEQADSKGQELLGVLDELIPSLTQARHVLSLKFDVPPEPLDERE